MADLNRTLTASEIINAAAVECGLGSVGDPFASTDQAFVQLRTLLTSAGRELAMLYRWQVLTREFSHTTSGADATPGKYDLPADFLRIVDQTGWERTNNVPFGGPLTPPFWTAILGSENNPFTIYAAIRQVQNQVWILPTPPPNGLQITFEYQSRGWVRAPGAPPYTYKDNVTLGGDVVLFEPVVIIAFLRYKFLEAKGFDTSKAEANFLTLADMYASSDSPGAILDMAGAPDDILLDERNIPDSGYGL